MKKYELLLIDLDGTILDFNKSEEEAIKHCFLNYGIEPNKENIKLRNKRLNVEGFRKRRNKSKRFKDC